MRLRGISTQPRPIIRSSSIPARCMRSRILKPPSLARSSTYRLGTMPRWIRKRRQRRPSSLPLTFKDKQKGRLQSGLSVMRLRYPGSSTGGWGFRFRNEIFVSRPATADRSIVNTTPIVLEQESRSSPAAGCPFGGGTILNWVIQGSPRWRNHRITWSALLSTTARDGQAKPLRRLQVYHKRCRCAPGLCPYAVGLELGKDVGGDFIVEA